jgi:hypothetical protein
MKEYIIYIILGIILYFILQNSINKFSIGITSWKETHKDGTTKYYYNRMTTRQDIEQRCDDKDYIEKCERGDLPAEQQLIEMDGIGPDQTPHTEDYGGNTYHFFPGIRADRSETFVTANWVYNWDGMPTNVDLPPPQQQPQQSQRSLWERLLQCASSINQ